MSADFLQAINNPATRRTLQVTQLLGHDTLVLAFLEAGFDQAEAQSSTDEVIREVVERLDVLAMPEGDVAKLVDVADDLLRRLIELGPETKSGVERANGIVENDTQVQGRATDVGIASLLVALSLSLMLGVAKLEGRYDWKTGKGHVAVEKGVPDGFTDILRAVGGAVSDRLGAPRSPDPGPPASPPGQTSPGAGEGPSARTKPAIRRHGSTHRKRLSRDEALATAAEIDGGSSRNGDFAELLGLPPEELYANRKNIIDVEGEQETALTVGAGIVPTGEGGFGVAVRVRSHRYLKPKVLRRLASFYNETFGPFVQTRWAGPVQLASSNPDGAWRPWVGPVNGGLAIGSPINTAGGCVGAVGLFVRSQDTYFALTAGHSLSDCRPDTVGKEVYFLPQPLIPDATKLIGTVERVEYPRRVALLPSLAPEGPAGSGFDHALAKLDVGHVPTRDKRMKAGARTFSPHVHILDETADFGAQVMKSVARSREAYGVITAFGVAIEAIDHVRGGAVRIEGLVEVEFDRPDSILPGDSGALMCLDRAGTSQPFGICIAGSKRSKIRSPEGEAKSAAYVLPIEASLRRLGDLEIC